MRIWLYLHGFPPESLGGTELYSLRLAKALASRDHQVRVVCYGATDAAEPGVTMDTVEGLSVVRVRLPLEPSVNPILDAYDHATVADIFERLMGQERPDVLVTTHGGHLSTSPLAVAQSMGIPTLAILTDFWAICPAGLLTRSDGTLCGGPNDLGACLRCYAHMGPRGAKLRMLSDALPTSVWEALISFGAGLPMTRIGAAARALRDRADVIKERLLACDSIVVLAEFQREILRRNGYPLEKLILSPHGLPDPDALIRTSPLGEADALRLGYAGPLAEFKGAHLPIAALERLGQSPISLSYWGSVPDTPYATDIMARLQAHPRASHCGRYEQAGVRAMLDQIDVLVVPSLCYENTPTVIYEALASRTPVIATDAGGMRELVTLYSGGWLFARGSADALATAMRRLVDNRNQVRRQAEAILPIPRMADHVDKIEALCRQAAAQGSST